MAMVECLRLLCAFGFYDNQASSSSARKQTDFDAVRMLVDELLPLLDLNADESARNAALMGPITREQEASDDRRLLLQQLQATVCSLMVMFFDLRANERVLRSVSKYSECFQTAVPGGALIVLGSDEDTDAQQRAYELAREIDSGSAVMQDKLYTTDALESLVKHCFHVPIIGKNLMMPQPSQIANPPEIVKCTMRLMCCSNYSLILSSFQLLMRHMTQRAALSNCFDATVILAFPDLIEADKIIRSISRVIMSHSNGLTQVHDPQAQNHALDTVIRGINHAILFCKPGLHHDIKLASGRSLFVSNRERFQTLMMNTGLHEVVLSILRLPLRTKPSTAGDDPGDKRSRDPSIEDFQEGFTLLKSAQSSRRADLFAHCYKFFIAFCDGHADAQNFLKDHLELFKSHFEVAGVSAAACSLVITICNNNEPVVNQVKDNEVQSLFNFLPLHGCESRYIKLIMAFTSVRGRPNLLNQASICQEVVNHSPFILLCQSWSSHNQRMSFMSSDRADVHQFLSFHIACVDLIVACCVGKHSSATIAKVRTFVDLASVMRSLLDLERNIKADFTMGGGRQVKMHSDLVMMVRRPWLALFNAIFLEGLSDAFQKDLLVAPGSRLFSSVTDDQRALMMENASMPPRPNSPNMPSVAGGAFNELSLFQLMLDILTEYMACLRSSIEPSPARRDPRLRWCATCAFQLLHLCASCNIQGKECGE